MSNNKNKIVNTSTIQVKVHRNAENLAVAMDWDATGSPVKGPKPCEALMMSLWDGQAKNTLVFGLWTKDLPLNEMQHFIFQTLATMSQTYFTASKDEQLSKRILEFAEEFAAKTNIKPPNTTT